MSPSRIIISIAIVIFLIGNIFILKETKALFFPHKEQTLKQPALLQKEGFILPIQWNDLGRKLIDTGVIDRQKLEQIYQNRGGLSEEYQALLAGTTKPVVINEKNAGFLLNLLWGFGLSNKNDILEKGPMMSDGFAEAGRFASTGGWSLAKNDPMDHYSKHSFIILTPEQQILVEKVSKNIYRPCCGNSTYFPDCNHGMAMLGLLEILASQGTTEKAMYETALAVNSYWFTDTYKVIAQYIEEKEKKSWTDVDPKEILGEKYSSGRGFQQILSEIKPPEKQSGGSCSV